MANNDGRYYWIKLKTDFFSEDSPIDFLLSQKNGSEYVALYIKLCLATANNDGRMCQNFGEVIVPYDVEKIQRDMKHFSIDTIRVAMELYQKLGLIYRMEDGVLAISNFDSMVGSNSASREAIKKADYRRRLRLETQLGTNDGTKEGTECPTEIRDKEIRDKSIDIRDKNLEIRDTDNKKKSKKEKAPAVPVVYYPNDEYLDNTFKEYIKMRKFIKAPMTDKAIELAMSKLEKLAMRQGIFDNDLAVKIINQSIENSWKGIFPLKEEKNDKKQKTKQDLFDEWNV